MKKILISAICCAIFVIAFSLMGAISVSAARATTDKGLGCFVSGDGFDYYLDLSCSAHDVIKFDDEGNFEFYEYQDHGQLPEEATAPSRTLRNNYEQCLNFSFGEVCGTVNEIVTPSGEYKSSFKSH